MDKVIIETQVTVTVIEKQIVIPAPKVSTMECPGLTTIRRDGNTTRQINFAVERLFKGDRVIVEDHYGSRKANHRLLELILWRFWNDFPNDFNKLDVDKYKYELELK